VSTNLGQLSMDRRSADWQSAVSPIANRRYSRLPTGATLSTWFAARFMVSMRVEKTWRLWTPSSVRSDLVLEGQTIIARRFGACYYPHLLNDLKESDSRNWKGGHQNPWGWPVYRWLPRRTRWFFCSSAVRSTT
jgi:hypothetical protein